MTTTEPALLVAPLPLRVDTTIRFRRDAEVSQSSGEWRIAVAGAVLAISPDQIGWPPAWAQAAYAGRSLAGVVECLTSRDQTDLELAEDVFAADRTIGVLWLQLLLRWLDNRGLLEHTVRADKRPLATLRPLALRPVMRGRVLDPEVQTGLSRFALLRTVDGRLRLESPCSTMAIELHDPRLAGLIAVLASHPVLGSVDAVALALPAAVLSPVATLLADAGMLVVGPPATGPEAPGQPLADWSFHDLLFHSRSRFGRTEAPYGAVQQASSPGSLMPPAAGPCTRPRLQLTRPDLAAIAAADPACVTVMESRRSVREHDDAAPLTIHQLGELLFRTARTRGVRQSSSGAAIDRPYPSGGALHELGLYVAATRCEGLSPGLYSYDAVAHALDLVAEPTPRFRVLYEFAQRAALMDRPPQVVLLITARFEPVMRKYQSMAYALIMKNVGVLYQSLYLASTAMGLAPCAIGGGDADTLSAVAGLDYYAESTVGEFIIGSKKPVS